MLESSSRQGSSRKSYYVQSTLEGALGVSSISTPLTDTRTSKNKEPSRMSISGPDAADKPSASVMVRSASLMGVLLYEVTLRHWVKHL